MKPPRAGEVGQDPHNAGSTISFIFAIWSSVERPQTTTCYEIMP